MVSLRTRHFREAEHRAGLVDGAFDDALARARAAVSAGAPALNAILRDYLREALERDTPHDTGVVPVSTWPLPMLKAALADTRDALGARDPRNVAAVVERLIRQHALPEAVRDRLGIGVLEADLRLYQRAIRRAQGEEGTVFTDAADSPVGQAPAASSAPPSPPDTPPASPPKPLASVLAESFFDWRKATGRATYQVISQERDTIRLFVDVCGNRPVDSYSRADITAFHGALRKLPAKRGRSSKDKGLTAAAFIERAEASGEKRISDKTLKRHHSALSQFFRLAMDNGHITNEQRRELVEDHRFREAIGARHQRDAWTRDELTKLFGSPL